MASLSRILAALLIGVCAPGSQAWAQLAVLKTAPISAPVAPILIQPGSSFKPSLSSAPSLSAPRFASPQLTTPTLPVPAALGPTASAAAVAAAAAQPVTAAQASPSAEAPNARALSERMRETARSAAPLIEAASAQGGTASEAHGTGSGIEALITGLRRIPESATSAALGPAPHRNGIVPGAGAGLLHAAEESLAEQAAVQPAVPQPLPPGAERRFKFYAAGVSGVKVGIETLNLVVPILLLTQYGTAAVLGSLFVSAQVAGLVSGAVAGPILDKIGPARALGFSAALQMLAIGVVPVSLLLGTPVSLPVIFGLFIVNGALSGVFDIARRAALPGILGTDESTLRRYNAKLYIVREIAAMGAVFGAGWLLHNIGALATLTLHPGAYMVAAAAFFLLAKGFRPAAGGGAAAPPGEEPSLSRWSDLVAGAKLVLKDPALRLAAAVNIPVIAFHNLFHAMLAAVYATSILGSPALAAVLIGAWNAGELAAAFYMDRRGSDGASVSWIRYAALTSLVGWALWAVPSIWVAAPAAFLLATGTLGNEIGLASFFQATAPKERVGAVTGFVYSAATAVAMAFILAIGAVFDAWGAGVGMLALAGVLTLISGFYLLAAKKLSARMARGAD
ncbi:MAG: MFS transporter [Elusimicrobia bacterium]|nr:MFS transporter [Elusimicrobiota bacterium]